MNQATEIYAREFDAILFRLPPQVQGRIEARIREMGRRLDDFPHARLQGRAEFRLRLGDYRIIYAFDVNYAVKSSLLLSFLESVPEVAAKLKEPSTKDRKFEDVVKSAEKAAVLVLVY